MKEEKDQPQEDSGRRNFLKMSLLAGGATMTGAGLIAAAANGDSSGEKIKVLTTDGKVIEVDKPNGACKINPCDPPNGEEARHGVPGRSFVMVIDLAKCNNARKCIEGCQKGHDLLPDQEWMKVYLMKPNPESDPYWFPKNCFHCDNPPCVKVCPVGATFKRTDNAVLVDADRCIGCKFCVSACPYSARIVNWIDTPNYSGKDPNYSPETSVPSQHGIVGKCDFCVDRSREGKLPYCAGSCPMGVIYYGDRNEDSVTNGEETLRFSQLIKDRAAFRYLEELGTAPNVYYLPPTERIFPYERGLENISEEKRKADLKSISKK